MAVTYDIIVVNEADGCLNSVTQQYTVTACTQYVIVRFDGTNNAVGPFDIYTGTTGTTAVYSAATRQQMFDGVAIELSDPAACSGLTPTPTRTVTPTPTITPTNTPTVTTTPTITPTPTISVTPTITPTLTPTISITPSVTPSITPSITPTKTVTPTITPTKTPTQTPTNTPTNTVTPSITPSITPTISITPSITPTTTVTPTNTQTPTITPTPTISVTPTITPTVTPSSAGFLAYIFAEPINAGDTSTLDTWAGSNGAVEWGSYNGGGGPPNNSGGNYSNDLDVYAHQPSFVGGGGNFVTPVTFSSPINQSTYLFSSIQVSSTVVNSALQYFYSIWLPLNGIGGTLNNYQIDLGTTPSGNEIFDDLPSITPTTNAYNVIVTPGAAIPAGTYRVLWITPNLLYPGSLPLTGSIYFTGAAKT